jgi:predicted outer membrane repeat protein
MARLNHPGIVAAIESGEAGGFLYLVMEHVDGPDVSRLLRQSGRLAPEVAVSIACQLAEALAYAHASGVIHRDIKPGNILLTRDGRVKVTDFGLACQADDSRPDLTSSNVAVGTADYLAPEALRPGVRVDARADLYSLGVTLFQMLSGTVPRGRWKMPSQTIGTDPRLDDILRRALATDPDQRYPDSTTILKDLEPVRAGLPPTPAEKRAVRLRTLRRWAPVPAILATCLLALPVWRWMNPPPEMRVVPVFSKAEDFIEVPAFGMNAPSDELTIEFWAQPTAYRGQAIVELVPDELENRCRFILNGHGGGSVWEFGSAVAGGQLVTPRPRGILSNWTHYALVTSRRDNRMQVFTNGTLHAEKSGASSFANRQASLRVGGDRMPFHGMLSDFRVWSHARTPEQIRSGMKSRPSSSEPGLVLHFPLDSITPAVVTNAATASTTSLELDGRFTRQPTWTNVLAPGQRIPPRPEPESRTWTVQTLADEGEGSLRAALAKSQDGDRIRFDPSLSGGTIHLTQGQLLVQSGVDIDALNLRLGITINANRKSRVLEVSSTSIVRMAGLTLVEGSDRAGGGIINSGCLQMQDCVVSNNQSSHDGGGIYSGFGSSLELTRCNIIANRTESFAGGLWIGGEPGASLTNCLFSANEARLGAGAILGYFSPLLLVSTTVSGNSARETGTGGVQAEGRNAYIANSILSENRGLVGDPVFLISGARRVDLTLPPESQVPPPPNP